MVRAVRVLAVVAQKGGVGKTTLAAHIAARWSTAAWPALLVDADPQASATRILLGGDAEPPTLADVWAGASPMAAAIRPATEWGVHVVSSALALANAEHDLRPEAEWTLSRELAGLTDRYRWAVVDCPPPLGRLVLAALVAADGAVTVTEPSLPCLASLEDVARTLAVVRQHYRPELADLGVIVNRAGRTREGADRLAQLRGPSGPPLVGEPIPEHAALAAAIGVGVPVWELGGPAVASVSATIASLADLLRRRLAAIGRAQP